MVHDPEKPPPWALGEWTLLDDIIPYVTQLCQEIVAGELEPYVAGWFFGNEVYSSSHYLGWDATKFGALVAAVHTAQLAEECNFPYYWAEFVAATDGAAVYPYTVRAFWTRNPGNGDPWDYRVPDTFRDWLDTFPFTEDQDTEKLIMQTHYYPWGTPLVQWRYDRTRMLLPAAPPGIPSPLYEELPDEGPWRVWSTILDADDACTGDPGHAFRTAFDIEDYPKSNLEFQPKFELNRQSEASWPGHVDAHKVIRVHQNMRRQWNEVRDDDRLTGFWIMIWNQATPVEDMLWQQWTETGSHLYAEAV